ncbi:hypothetical protein ACE1B6_01950 [Aerosakkonemataceae cyanobacterium BLCC-F154]|uniref:Uncharacterized protein n=1 Tax=Floridaenema fluviatile BLCC-F154 TaxID=3153640 RepID=A0ABV4Y6W2_9CYAN
MPAIRQSSINTQIMPPGRKLRIARPRSTQTTKVMPRIKLKIEINLQFPELGVLATIFFPKFVFNYGTAISHLGLCFGLLASLKSHGKYIEKILYFTQIFPERYLGLNDRIWR